MEESGEKEKGCFFQNKMPVHLKWFLTPKNYEKGAKV
jgi:hypothetical protein